LRLRARTQILPLLCAAYVAAFAVVLLRENVSGNYPAYGAFLNSVLGYPCWLLGALLAEQIDSWLAAETPGRLTLWRWRFGTIALATFLSALRFHTPLTYPWTLNLFALYVFAWLRVEIRFANARGANRTLEAAGAFSYSIYLTHLFANAVWLRNSHWLSWAEACPTLSWAFQVAFILLVSYASYRLVEKPSHVMARQFQRWFGLRSASWVKSV